MKEAIPANHSKIDVEYAAPIMPYFSTKMIFNMISKSSVIIEIIVFVLAHPTHVIILPKGVLKRKAPIKPKAKTGIKLAPSAYSNPNNDIINEEEKYRNMNTPIEMKKKSFK